MDTNTPLRTSLSIAVARSRRKVPWTAIFFLGPAVIAFLLFKYYPLVQAIFMSFFDYKLMDPPGKFIGLENYILLFKSTYFWTAFGNTFVFAFLYLALTFWVPILQAILLSELRKANLLFRFLYLLPHAVPGVASYILWKWIYNPDYGLLNNILSKIGLGPYGWLNDPAMAKTAIVLPGMLGGGIAVLLYYSALVGMSKEVVEAAKIDGAGPWKRMWYVTLPGMSFIIGIQFIAFLAGVFLTFDSIYIMTGGGPVNSTRVLSLVVFESAFKEYRFGLAGAVSFIMFILIAGVTYIQLRLSKARAS